MKVKNPKKAASKDLGRPPSLGLLFPYPGFPLGPRNCLKLVMLFSRFHAPIVGRQVRFFLCEPSKDLQGQCPSKASKGFEVVLMPSSENQDKGKEAQEVCFQRSRGILHPSRGILPPLGFIYLDCGSFSRVLSWFPCILAFNMPRKGLSRNLKRH